MDLSDKAIQFSSEETYTLGERLLPNQLIFCYDTTRWAFRQLVTEYLGTADLEMLHLDPRFNPQNQSAIIPNYQATRNSWAISRRLKESISPLAESLFRDLLYGLIGRFLYPIEGYQPLAAIRVNFHGAKAILKFHKDSEYGQTPLGINLWLPVTNVGGSNSMYLESEVDRGDFKPLELQYGQACIFRGGDLMHGTRDNDSGSTRISFDIRFRVKQP